MNRTNKTSREKLLALEKPNATYKEKYKKEIKKMVEMRLGILKIYMFNNQKVK